MLSSNLFILGKKWRQNTIDVRVMHVIFKWRLYNFQHIWGNGWYEFIVKFSFYTLFSKIARNSPKWKEKGGNYWRSCASVGAGPCSTGRLPSTHRSRRRDRLRWLLADRNAGYPSRRLASQRSCLWPKRRRNLLCWSWRHGWCCEACCAFWNGLLALHLEFSGRLISEVKPWWTFWCPAWANLLEKATCWTTDVALLSEFSQPAAPRRRCWDSSFCWRLLVPVPCSPSFALD